MSKEINLLPKPLLRKRTRRLYLCRLGRFLNRIYLLLLLLVGALAAIFVVFQQIEEGMAGSKTEGDGFHSEVVREVEEVNRLLREFEQRRVSYQPWSDSVEDALEIMPPALRLTGLEVHEEEPSVLVINGTASERQAVVEYQQKLKGLDWVRQVEAPLRNFALEPEPTFSFKLHRR